MIEIEIDGEVIRHEFDWASSPPLGQIGDRKSFLVDPENSQDVRLASESSLYTGPILVTSLGLLGVLVCGGLLLAGSS